MDANLKRFVTNVAKAVHQADEFQITDACTTTHRDRIVIPLDEWKQIERAVERLTEAVYAHGT